MERINVNVGQFILFLRVKPLRHSSLGHSNISFRSVFTVFLVNALIYRYLHKEIVIVFTGYVIYEFWEKLLTEALFSRWEIAMPCAIASRLLLNMIQHGLRQGTMVSDTTELAFIVRRAF